MSKPKTRAVAVLINEGKILLIHRTKRGKEFWVLPGGGVEENEKVKDAVVREVEEKASIKSETVRQLYTHKYSDIGGEQHFYLCKYISGTPKLGEFNELETMKNEDQTYDPQWVDMQKLPELLLYPLEIRDWLIEDYKNNFEDTPRTATLKTTELRQEI